MRLSVINKAILMLGNYSIHRNRDCMKLFKDLKHQAVFNLEYSPQFASVEMWLNILK